MKVVILAGGKGSRLTDSVYSKEMKINAAEQPRTANFSPQPNLAAGKYRKTKKRKRKIMESLENPINSSECLEIVPEILKKFWKIQKFLRISWDTNNFLEKNILAKCPNTVLG